MAAASQEQSQGIAQINTAVSQMDRVTQSNAATAEESAAAAEALSTQARTLDEAVLDLTRLVGGGGVRPASSTPAGGGSAPKRPPGRRRTNGRPGERALAHCGI